ncbi:MAG: AmmeMemoRadiSam system protein B [bacterium]|nr:AmmeMemoRadiSam system protein B [bacterium]
MQILRNKNCRCLALTVLFYSTLAVSATIRSPQFAGSFYPSDPEKLKVQITGFLKQNKETDGTLQLCGLIVPHAGYIYSGKTSGFAYSLLKDRKIDTVFLIGRSHSAKFLGIVTDDRDFWRTPMGDVQVDKKIVSDILVKPGFRVDYDILDNEHSLEVQVPFLQCVIKGNFRIVPVLMGCENETELDLYAKYLAPFVKKTNSIIVLSTDLSHYHSDEIARRMDSRVISILEEGKFLNLLDGMKKGEYELCGGSAVYMGLKILSEISTIKIRMLDYSNSADTTKDKSRVVGYVSMAIYRDTGKSPETREKKMLNKLQRQTLLKIARETLQYHLSGKKLPELTIDDPVLLEKRGVFVTLRKKGELRGCIGTLLPQEPLVKAVRSMAIQSATADPRFPSVSFDELKDIEIEISVLTVPVKVSGPDDIVLGRDGVIVKKGFRQGVFLPQVADETGWTKEQFLSALCAHKAGLEPDAWKKPDTELYTFQAEVFSEHNF